MDEQKIMDGLRAEGYQKIYIWDAESDEFDAEHQHDFDTKLVILKGEIQIKSERDDGVSNMNYKSGSELLIPRHTIHEAKAGPDGCRYIVAEKHY